MLALHTGTMNDRVHCAGSAPQRECKLAFAPALARARNYAARDSLLPEIPVADQNLGVIVIYFYFGETTLDLDNIARSLLDALKGVLVIDDRQVSQLVVRKARLTTGLSLNGASPLLLGIIDSMSRAGSDFVYIRVDPAPDLSRIP